MFLLWDLADPTVFKEAEDSEGFIGCKMSGSYVSRSPLTKSVGKRLTETNY